MLVGVADLKATDLPHAAITTYALGSCLGVCCYDRANRIGGMLHAMLPDSSQSARRELKSAMYLDTGVPALLQSVIELGGDPKHSEFKVFGGARVGDGTDFFNIGSRNVEAMTALIHRYDLEVNYWHVGGQTNRTITLYLDNGDVRLRMPGRQEFIV
ncbi:CheD [Opitutus terrae PB90-1]|uniref:Probable chemoreceptor glutamine deamidase CheD n=1 Tax=Opitutus terrae (strain DSM 11246 / JCM 15787 / PB90-1) TaxID=452637 RepID=B1ZV82_OPITP|nr:CheD [Opitutus terrae PB90-1]